MQAHAEILSPDVTRRRSAFAVAATRGLDSTWKKLISTGSLVKAYSSSYFMYSLLNSIRNVIIRVTCGEGKSIAYCANMSRDGVINTWRNREYIIDLFRLSRCVYRDFRIPFIIYIAVSPTARGVRRPSRSRGYVCRLLYLTEIVIYVVCVECRVLSRGI